MKKLIFAYLILFPWSFAWADTLTSRAALTIPTTTQADVWGAKINNNFNTIDSSSAFTGINATNDFRGTNYFSNVRFYNPGRDDYSYILSNGNSSRSQMILYSPDDGVGINTLTELNSLQGYVDLAVKGGNALDGNPAGGRFVVLGSSADASVAYSGFRSSSPINTSTIWSLPRQDGSSGQILSTDGSSHLSFISGSSINSGITSTQVAFSSSTGALVGSADITANAGACGGGGGTALNIGTNITDKFSVTASGNCTGATILKTGSPRLTLSGSGSAGGTIGVNGSSANDIVSGAKTGDMVITAGQDQSLIFASNTDSSSKNVFRVNSTSSTFLNTSQVVFTSATLLGTLTAGSTVGTFGKVLVSSGIALNPSWAYQGIVKSSACTITTSSSTTSSSFITTNLSCSIVPKGTGNQIRISFSGSISSSNGTATTAFATIARNGSNILTSAGCADFLSNVATTTRAPVSCVYQDTNSTTAGTSVTYSVQIRSSDGVNTVFFPSANIPNATMILDEIGMYN